MHQLLCGVDDSFQVDSIRIQVLDVNEDSVTLEISRLDHNDDEPFEVTIPRLATSENLALNLSLNG